MDGSVEGGGDLAGLQVPLVGALRATGSLFDPFELVDAAGERVGAVTEFLRELQGRGRAEGTQESYGRDLLRWFRFVWALEVPWAQATRIEARDFVRWLQVADKPRRPHWRTGAVPAPGAVAPGTANAVTGRRSPGVKYAASTVAHTETVAREFYDYHLHAGSGPVVNPFPLARPGRRAHAHHNPMEPFGRERAGLYRPRGARRVPKQIPDGMFDELFARLRSDRDRALLAFWVSTGARASELLGLTVADADPGCQTVRVVRKGSRAVQPLPASTDAFVWLRLYQARTAGLVPAGPDDPVWWTRRAPVRPLGYDAARAMFGRANGLLGANWTLHHLRHTASYRMARDPLMPLTDVQWVLGHAHLTTTQIYVNPTAEDVVEGVLAHHRRRAQGPLPPPPGTGGYRPESLEVLFGGRAW
ncbi:site-specific integrase [Pseudofrankia sp. DC12]|uniref:tyrosine-type recombinase/integrase n=1 Tax=Pseudofrankia sp. DC12 TaxID=683315 RepID=UPI0005F7668E|nr:site-specific integrase [Pseudofrankia sp. DC12]